MTKQRQTAAQRNRKHIKNAKPTSTNQKKQILHAQNQIVAIKRQINVRREPVKWKCGFTDAIVDSYPLVVPLTSGPTSVLSRQAKLNNTAATNVGWSYTMSNSVQNSGSNRSKCFVHKQYVDLAIKSGTEPSLLSFTAFLVQLKPEVATETYSETTQMTVLENDKDYCSAPATTSDSGYGAFVNSTRYKILKRIELETSTLAGASTTNTNFSTGNVGQGTRSNQIHRAQLRVNYGNTLIKAPAGQGDNDDLDTVDYDDIKPESKRFLVIFSDNSFLDGQYPKISMSSLITGQAL